ncbi:hypothetical protein M409DRAFT_61204 [Zasmidium cellare ATCC 36951]|uniref:Uncharacterized protein n=1 Tax=Zasmidium cellare ATCC 36951 TaxID=1080233 RepID=A0A6A6BZA6_ZASCE|nr:uncharacterized protein M409DRAFT_61204 [Zasmidium cellare ATCC 36951]KAF2158932.1 hypothetical protein M409DRAFT_61204 [Zasmidium cellare ATCC 36951]
MARRGDQAAFFLTAEMLYKTSQLPSFAAIYHSSKRTTLERPPLSSSASNSGGFCTSSVTSSSASIPNSYSTSSVTISSAPSSSRSITLSSITHLLHRWNSCIILPGRGLRHVLCFGRKLSVGCITNRIGPVPNMYVKRARKSLRCVVGRQETQVVFNSLVLTLLCVRPALDLPRFSSNTSHGHSLIHGLLQLFPGLSKGEMVLDSAHDVLALSLHFPRTVWQFLSAHAPQNGRVHLLQGEDHRRLCKTGQGRQRNTTRHDQTQGLDQRLADLEMLCQDLHCQRYRESVPSDEVACFPFCTASKTEAEWKSLWKHRLKLVLDRSRSQSLVREVMLHDDAESRRGSSLAGSRCTWIPEERCRKRIVDESSKNAVKLFEIAGSSRGRRPGCRAECKSRSSIHFDRHAKANEQLSTIMHYPHALEIHTEFETTARKVDLAQPDQHELESPSEISDIINAISTGLDRAIPFRSTNRSAQKGKALVGESGRA